MSDFVHKTNNGSMFKNEYKKTDSHPEYKGTVDVDGVVWEVAAWVKDGKKGKYLSLAVSVPRPKESGAGGTPSAPTIDDDIPFAVSWDHIDAMLTRPF